MISDKELSLNIYIKEDKYSKYIIFKVEGKIKKKKLCLKDKPIALQYTIICKETTCY